MLSLRSIQPVLNLLVHLVCIMGSGHHHGPRSPAGRFAVPQHIRKPWELPVPAADGYSRRPAPRAQTGEDGGNVPNTPTLKLPVFWYPTL